MSKIVLPETDEKVADETQGEELKYEATEADEEKFFLMYHMHWAPSEVDALPEDRRQWILARFIGQKNMEQEHQEAIKQQRMNQHLAEQLKHSQLKV